MQRNWMVAGIIGVVASGAATALMAQTEGGLPPAVFEKLKTLIVDPDVRMTVSKVDHERLVVRRLDIVDEKGVIRMTLAGRSPNGIMDGVEYRRACPVSGITLYDERGSERGGFGIADIPGAAAVLASDHANHDAIGWRVMPDGSVMFAMNGREQIISEPRLGNKLVPGLNAKSRLSMNLAPDGSPSIELADKEGRARIRLATGSDGGGEIQFLNEEGRIIQRISGEGLQGMNAK